MCEAEGMREGSSLRETSKDVEKCANCIVLAKEKRQLSNNVKNLRAKLKEKRNELAKITKKIEGKLSWEASYGNMYSC